MASSIVLVNSHVTYSRFAPTALATCSSTEFFGDPTRLMFSGRKWLKCALSTPSVSCSGVKTNTSSDSMTADLLQDKFGRQGVRFVDVGDMPTTELKLRNGSSVRMMLPRAQITSYKADMWHGAEEEILHSVRSESEKLTSTSIRGDIKLNFNPLKDTLSSILPCSQYKLA